MINKHDDEFALLNKTTGEISDLKQGDTIISKEEKERRKRFTLYNRDKRHFSFGKMERIKDVSLKLDTKKCGYILKLIPFMEYGTGYLLREDGKVMATKTDLGKGLGVKKVSSRNQIIDSLSNVSALKLDEKGYKLNPDLHIKGAVNGKELIKLFSTTLKKLSNDLQPAQLGYLYKLLPFVHYETNLICINPHEEETEKIEYLNQKAIIEILGIDNTDANKFLRKCHKNGILFEGSTMDRRERKYYVNPYLFFRKKGYPDKTLESMFASSPYHP
ncbi:hypothetical protein [Cytobacillus horneckiae]|uniref:Uncharacterized protein n=1 Tax=Cytobacillus horneckiae TaxID=549687 RepID=A0A2N0ZMA5_9BACI|nr:hypothetical protein [Cytobacillus horneckiae]MEC1155029.1 hypothetical protein [Cytobacillus horneckiae]MED2936065.1 hypothetical protein [Cytobacillus horneckiae]PKG30661.1 hypothetical protein CWS20_01880 [Cytobacillus horneckiae]